MKIQQLINYLERVKQDNGNLELAKFETDYSIDNKIMIKKLDNCYCPIIRGIDKNNCIPIDSKEIKQNVLILF